MSAELLTGHKQKTVFLFLEHVLSILASLLRNLTGNQRSRLVQKFIEDDHIKVRAMEGIIRYIHKEKHVMIKSLLEVHNRPH